MKKLIISLAVLISASASPAYSQGFLDKISKGVEKINKKLDDLTKSGDQETVKSAETTYLNNSGSEAYKNVQIKSFSSQIDLVLESCIRDGNKVIITYYLANKGNDLTILRLGAKKTIINPNDETLIVGNDGKNYSLTYYELGNVNTNTVSRLTLPSGIRLKGKFEIANVSAATRQFSLVNIAGLIELKRNPDDFKPFSFSFKNVPIYSLDETLAMQNPTTLSVVENPGIQNISLENTGIKSITLTDKYTRVDCFWKNTQFNPQGSIFVENMESCYIEAGGKKYALVQYAGMGARREDVWVKYNQTADFTYIFEPVPATTSSFDIHGDGISFTGVNLKEEPTTGINIPQTTGLFTALNTAYDAFYGKTRMTAADRKNYQIDKVKHEFIIAALPNADLAKGKTIYQGNEGRIETFLNIRKDNGTNEYLVSYDKDGNYKDCICIASLSEYGGDRGYGVICGNKVVVHSYYPAEEGEPDLEYLTEYTIKPDLAFSKGKESTQKPQF